MRWPPGSERAAEGNAEGRNGAQRGMEMYTTREEIREKKQLAPPRAGWFPGWNFAERPALPPKAAGLERKAGNGRKVYRFFMLIFSSFFVHLYKHKKGWLFCAYLYVYTKKKKMYM